MDFKFIKKNKVSKLPSLPGVYAFKNGGAFLYIGKAGNIKNRVKNHFRQPGFKDDLFLEKTDKIGYIQTDSEIEALILEAKLIKEHNPKYNVLWKDDKNYFYVAVSKEKCPAVYITHQAEKFQMPKSKFQIKFKAQNPKTIFIGPFINGRSLKTALRILRKIFPHYTAKKHPKNLCPYCHLGLCPGPDPDLKECKKNIKNLTAVLLGKKQSVLKNLKSQMKIASKSQDFERAGKIRDQIFALEKVLAHAKIFNQEKLESWEKTEAILRKILRAKNSIHRIEGYDISNIQGKKATGSMVVFTEGKPNKNFYRKFKIKIEGKPNDTAMLKEVLQRRLSHEEWPYPDFVLVDGGKAQLNAALSVLDGKIIAGALAKRKNELFLKNQKNPLLLKNLPREIFSLILQIRDEAHRFAKSYHHKLMEMEAYKP